MPGSCSGASRHRSLNGLIGKLTLGGVVNDSDLISRWRSWALYLLSVLRIVAAFLFIQFGTAKLFGFPAPIMPGGGTAPLNSLPGVAGFLETFGGRCCSSACSPGPWRFYWRGRWPLPTSTATRARASGRYSIRARLRSSFAFSSSTSRLRGRGLGVSMLGGRRRSVTERAHLPRTDCLP